MVLQTLDSPGPLHGHAIAARLEQVSGGGLQLRMGMLYPALMCLEQRGLLRGSWATTSLARERDAWDRMADIIHTLLHREA